MKNRTILKMTKLISSASFILISLFSFAQKEVTVTESIVSIDGNKDHVLYFGFAKGDQISLSVRSKRGRFLSEIEISELNGSVKFSDYRVKKINGKTIDVLNEGIYKFKFSNFTSKRKIYSLVIKRTAASSETQDFNTTVYWRTVKDTTFTEKKEKYLIKRDTSIVDLVDKVAKVHSLTNLNSDNKETTKFRLPPHTVAWSYYIGVDQAGQEAYQHATDKIDEITATAATIAELNPVSALALGLTHFIPMVQKGEDVNFYITDYENAVKFRKGAAFTCVKKGLVLNDFARMTIDLEGDHFLCLYNDNAVTGISVLIKIVAVVVNEEWGTKKVKTPHITEREEAYLLNIN